MWNISITNLVPQTFRHTFHVCHKYGQGPAEGEVLPGMRKKNTSRASHAYLSLTLFCFKLKEGGEDLEDTIKTVEIRQSFKVRRDISDCHTTIGKCSDGSIDV